MSYSMWSSDWTASFNVFFFFLMGLVPNPDLLAKPYTQPVQLDAGIALLSCIFCGSMEITEP